MTFSQVPIQGNYLFLGILRFFFLLCIKFEIKKNNKVVKYFIDIIESALFKTKIKCEHDHSLISGTCMHLTFTLSAKTKTYR